MFYLIIFQLIFIFLISFNVIPVTIPGIYPWRYSPIQHSFFIIPAIIYILSYIAIINYMIKKNISIKVFILALFIFNIGLYLTFFSMHYGKKKYPYLKGISYIIENTHNPHQNGFYQDAGKIKDLKQFFSDYHNTLWEKQWGHGPFHPPGKIIICYAFQKTYLMFPELIKKNYNLQLFLFQLFIVSLSSLTIVPLVKVSGYFNFNDFQKKSLAVIFSSIPNIIIFSPKMDSIFMILSITSFFYFLKSKNSFFSLNSIIFNILIFILSLVHFGVLSLVFMFFLFELLSVIFHKKNSGYFIKKIFFFICVFIFFQTAMYFFTGYNSLYTFININNNFKIYTTSFFPHNSILTRIFMPLDFYLFIGIVISFYSFWGLKKIFFNKTFILQISVISTFLCILISNKSFQENSRVLIFLIPFIILFFTEYFFEKKSVLRLNIILILSLIQTYIFKYYIVFYIF